MNKKPSEKQLQYAKQIEAATGIPIKNEGNVWVVSRYIAANRDSFGSFLYVRAHAFPGCKGLDIAGIWILAINELRVPDAVIIEQENLMIYILEWEMQY